MSKSINSPTARLLQSSRLFSLPRPLPPQDIGTITLRGNYKTSDTATAPFPTHQAITTPSSSLFRGDWGLKRPLPANAARADAHVTVLAQDTYDHITDFAPAEAHTRTAAKWLQMGVPMMQRPRGKGRARQKQISLYEDATDNTDPEAVDVQSILGKEIRGGPNIGVRSEDKTALKQRWKYEGPWFAGMSQGEFNAYVKGAIGKRRDEWREFIRAREHETRLRDYQLQARKLGHDATTELTEQARKELRPDDQQLMEIMKRYRDDHIRDGLRSQLTALITEFFDLPPIQLDAEGGAQSPLYTRLMKTLVDAPSGAPPSTHPAAGLSHLRSNTAMDNHPRHGPQLQRAPFEARVLRPRTSAIGGEYNAKIGVAGVVTIDPHSSTYTGKANMMIDTDADSMAHALDPDLKGGNKLWVHPTTASVDENGRISLHVERADPEAVAVKLRQVQAIHEAKRADAGNGISQPGSAFMPPSAGSWGGQSVENNTRARSSTRGFEGMYGQSSAQQFQQLGELYEKEER